MGVKVAVVVSAFFRVANKPSGRRWFGKWVPAKYWAFLVSQELENAKLSDLRRQVMI